MSRRNIFSPAVPGRSSPLQSPVQLFPRPLVPQQWQSFEKALWWCPGGYLPTPEELLGQSPSLWPRCWELLPISHKVFPVPWTSDTWTTAAFVKEVAPEVATGVREVSEPVFPEGLTLFISPPQKNTDTDSFHDNFLKLVLLTKLYFYVTNNLHVAHCHFKCAVGRTLYTVTKQMCTCQVCARGHALLNTHNSNRVSLTLQHS